VSRLRVAIQKSGRLSDKSLEILKSCGLSFARSKDKLFWYGRDFPVDVLLVRDDDIPRMLLDGVCELGIVGENIAREVMLERNNEDGLHCLRKLGFGHCRLSLAVPENMDVQGIASLEGMRIATSYPEFTRYLLNQHGVVVPHFAFKQRFLGGLSLGLNGLLQSLALKTFGLKCAKPYSSGQHQAQHGPSVKRHEAEARRRDNDPHCSGDSADPSP